MVTKFDATFQAPPQITYVATPGSPNHFDITFQDGANGQVVLRNIPRKHLAYLGLVSTAGVATNNTLYKDLKTYHDSL